MTQANPLQTINITNSNIPKYTAFPTGTYYVISVKNYFSRNFAEVSEMARNLRAQKQGEKSLID